MKERARARARERERQRERERDRDRQTDRQTETEGDRDRHRQTSSFPDGSPRTWRLFSLVTQLGETTVPGDIFKKLFLVWIPGFTVGRMTMIHCALTDHPR